VTDAHCHPTDLTISEEDYDAVKLGGICSMATVPEDQSKVFELGSGRPWSVSEPNEARPRPRVVSAFGELTVVLVSRTTDTQAITHGSHIDIRCSIPFPRNPNIITRFSSPPPDNRMTKMQQYWNHSYPIYPIHYLSDRCWNP
jgi:hypothetical protein